MKLREAQTETGTASSKQGNLGFTSSFTCFIAPGMAYIPVESDDVGINYYHAAGYTDF
jgi:hypothetical protein